MTYNDLIRHYHSDTAAGEAIGLGRQRVRAWKNTGNVPYPEQIEYERVTGGKLLAKISREDRLMLARNARRAA